MPNHRTILKLLLEERPWAEITQIASCSRRDISKVKTVIADHQVTSVDTVTEDMLAEWFPDRRRARAEYVPPDFASVLAAQKASKHFTLQLAWNRYADAPGVGKKYGYSQFCALYAEYVGSNDLVAVLHHDPGRAVFVDWAGDTMTLVDQTTGQTTKAYLFVAVLPYSGMVFCHAYLNMKTSAWLDAHVRAFALFEGVPQLVVPDNAATATHRMSKADRARVVTARYQELADHLNRPGNNGDSEATERTSLSCPKRNTPSSCAREPSAWSSTLSKQTLVPAAASSAVSATSSA